MKVTTEELERCETLLTVEIEPDQQEKLLKKAAQRFAREVKIPGFRPGKAPYNVIVRRFGIEALQSEALEHSVEELVKESMAEANIVPFAQIQLDGVEWEPALTIKIRVPTKPIVELGNYRDMRLEAKTVEVTEQDVEEALKRLQEQQATWAPVERPAELGDLISMTVTEKDGETVLTERQAVEYELKPVEAEEEDDDDDEDEFEDDEEDLDEEEDDDEEEEEDDDEEDDDDYEEEDSDDDEDDDDDDDYEEDDDDDDRRSSRIDLTTPLLGLSAGESKTFSVTYPDDFQNEQYAGKEITFEVEVSAVKAKELDPLDDEFAKQVGDYETLDALKEKIEEDIRQNRERMNNFELGSQALDKVIEGAEKIEWPVALEEEQIDHEVEHYEYHLKQSGLTLDAALRMQKKTKGELRDEFRENVAKQLKRGLVMGKVAESEQLKVSQMEVLEQAKMMADLYGGGDRMWQTILASEAQQSTIANELLSNKVIRRLAAVAKGEAPEPGEVEAAGETEADQEAENPPAADAGDEAQVAEEVTLSVEAEADQEAENPPAASTEDETQVLNESTESEISQV